MSITTQKDQTSNVEYICKFIETIIVEHTQDQPAALQLDLLGHQRNDHTRHVRHVINTIQQCTDTIQYYCLGYKPCDVLLFDPAKQKVRKAKKQALNTDECPSILMSCDELHKAIHEMRSEDIVQCWMNIAHQTIDELKGQLVHY